MSIRVYPSTYDTETKVDLQVWNPDDQRWHLVSTSEGFAQGLRVLLERSEVVRVPTHKGSVEMYRMTPPKEQ